MVADERAPDRAATDRAATGRAAADRTAWRWPIAWAALAMLVASVFGIVLAMRPPGPAGAGAPAQDFAAARALPHVQRVAAAPHPVGSAEHQKVVDYLLGELGRLGLEVKPISATTANAAAGVPIPVARVTTVWARQSGTAPTGTVYLVAHYDSVRTGAGANDNAVAVATLLEAARVLRTGAPPRNDVVFLFTDGEEDGLLGARQMLDAGMIDPASSIVVNLEARGTHGPLIGFETSTANSAILSHLGGAPLPLAFSLGQEVYRFLPNSTDFTELRKAGVGGVNLAYLDGSPRYHTAEDSVERVDMATLQHDGELALALARGFAAADLRAGTGPASTFFWVPGLLVHYPNALAWPLALLAALAVGGLVWYTRREAGLRWSRLGLAALSVLAPVVAAPLLAAIAWSLMTAVRPGYTAFLLGDTYRPYWARPGFMLLALAVVLSWYAWLRLRLGPAHLRLAGLAWLAGIGALLAAVAPGASYLFALPALAGAAAGAAAPRWRERPELTTWAHLAAAVVTAMIAVPVIALLLPTLGLAGAAVPCLLLVLLVTPALPLLEAVLPAPPALTDPVPAAAYRWLPWAPPAGAAALALVLLGTGLATDPVGAGSPRPSALVYTLDADTGAAQWLSADPAPSDWAARLAPQPPVPVQASWPNLANPFVSSYAAGPAAPAKLAAPRLSLVKQTAAGEGRVLRLRLVSARGAPVATLRLAASGPRLIAATVDGVTLSPDVEPRVAGDWGWGFIFKALPAKGIEIVLTFASKEPVLVRVIDATDGLTGLPGFIPRPAEVGTSPLPSDIVCVGRTVKL